MPTDPIQTLRNEYRLHLQDFYTHLNLAPPYHSIEKAVQHLSNTLRTKSQPVLQSLLTDPQKKWPLYEQIFEASGLSRKHRGIITKVAKTSLHEQGKDNFLRFLRVFTDAHSSSPC